jgi:hypothetical protein
MAGLGSSILDFMANITQLWKSPGMPSKGKRYEMNKSILSEIDLDKMDSSSPLMTFFGQNKKQLKTELQDFHLTKAIIELYSTHVMDAIMSSSLRISNAKEDYNSLTDKMMEDANHFLDILNIKNFIREHIDDMLYYGKFCYILIIKPDEKKFIFECPPNPYDFYLIECKNESYLAVYSEKNELLQKNSDNFIFYFNKKKSVKNIEGLLNQSEYNNKDSNNIVYDYNSIEDLLPQSLYFTGKGILDDNLNLLMSIYLNEFLEDQLNIRDATRKDIIIADIKDPKTPRNDVSDALDDFNETFNNNFLFNGASSSLRSMTAIIATNVIYEGVAVLPGHENYTNFETLDLPDLSDKKESLANIQISQRHKIFTNKGIPEGMFEGMGNKWDTLADASRFLTEVSSLLDSVIDFIKSIIIKYINSRYNIDITLSDINLELSVTNTISNSKWTRDIGLQSKMFSEVSALLRTIKDDLNIDNLYLDTRKYLESVDDALSVVNPSLQGLILIDKTIKELNIPTTEEDNRLIKKGNEIEENDMSDNEIPPLQALNEQEEEDKLSEYKERLQEEKESKKENDQNKNDLIEELKNKLDEKKDDE